MSDDDRYSALLDAGREPGEGCMICSPDSDAEPCSEECEAVAREALAHLAEAAQ